MKGIQTLLAAIGLVAALLVAGCGGGSASGSEGVNVFVTDDLRIGYDAVWVRVHRVILHGQEGDEVLYDSPNGEVVNLSALNDGGEQRFLFLGVGAVESGAYTRATIVLDDQVVLFPTGSSSGQQVMFAQGFLNADSKAEFSFDLSTAFSTGDRTIVFDFVLADWTLNGDTITSAKIERDDESGLGDVNRHNRHAIPGTIADLSGVAPNQRFRLNARNGRNFSVRTDANTVIYFDDGGGNPALQNAQRVVVKGRMDVNTLEYVASEIKIKDEFDDDQEVEGAVSNLNSGAGTLDIATEEVDGFVPTADIVHVASTGATVFLAKSGAVITKDEFFAAVSAQGSSAEAEGQYDANSNTLTAEKIKVEDDDDDDEDRHEARGALVSFDANAKTLTILLDEWEGFSASQGQSIFVRAQAGAEFRDDDDDDPIDEATFFSRLNAGLVIKVHGVYDGSEFSANRLRIRR